MVDDSFKVTSNVQEFLRLSLRHTKPYLTAAKGVPFWVHPQVMSPKYSYAPQFFSDHWDVGQGMTVLDVGTGCGILAVLAGLAGASQVVGVDINPHAVECAKMNVKLNGLEDKVDILQSDMYAAVHERRFERILFNAPFWNRRADPGIPLTFGVFDENYRATAAFLQGARQHLAPHGKILLGYALQDDVQLMDKKIQEAGLSIERVIDETRGHTRRLYYLFPRGE